ncbi:MAG: multidrug efflux SMR transporter [Bacteroidales bacterium]|nr:multidrug efflux SMR transporter [Bacteroidales bacterium]
MSWIYLFIAAAFEIGWPLGFKLSQTTSHKWPWIAVAAVSMSLSGFFLWLAQKVIPIGTAYAVWTGIGAVGTVIIGIVFFKDPAGLMRLLFIAMIITGVIGLKFT